MYLTLEVRWFYPGPLPDRIVNRLQERSCLPALLPARQDHYLLLDGQPSLGIKLREGNVEIKRRLEDPREVEIGPGAVGRVARWRKWSFPLAPGAARGPAFLEHLLVPASVPLEAPAEQGCEFELSRVWAGGEEWWSACFEAFGQGPLLEQALLAVAAKVLGRGWPVALEVERSWSYPAWLEIFAGQDEREIDLVK